jgi:hypothetical protein
MLTLEDAMNLDSGDFEENHYLDPDLFINQENLQGDSITLANSIPPMETLMSVHNINSFSREATFPKVLMHQVSIKLACTTEQLSSIISWLASIDSTMNINIDRE